MVTSINKNQLIEIPPGRYVRAGSNGSAFKEITKPTQGLIVTRHETLREKKDFQTVLVDGDLINWWSCKSNE